MGIFGAFGRALMGKPAYTPQQVEQEGAAQPNGTVQAAGPKTIPKLSIGRVENHASGQRLDVYADIHNESNEAVFLDRALLLGTTRQLDDQLRPGESKQFVIYSGPLLLNQPSGYVELRYRRQSDGDYFADYHVIRSRQEGSEGFIIAECLLAGPVKDI